MCVNQTIVKGSAHSLVRSREISNQLPHCAAKISFRESDRNSARTRQEMLHTTRGATLRPCKTTRMMWRMLTTLADVKTLSTTLAFTRIVPGHAR
jgi:hypothetical protein